MGTTRDTSQLFDLADSVVATINAATLSLTPVEVKRGYDITYKLEDAERDDVYVGVAIGEDAEEPGGARRSVQAASQIQVGVRVRVPDADNATVDPFVKFAGEIRNLFRGQRLDTYPADCQSATLLIPYIPEHLHKFKQFTSVTTLTFDTQNAQGVPRYPADGYAEMVSEKTSDVSVTVKHDGSDSATGICYSVDGGTIVYTAVAADTNLVLTIPHNSGTPETIKIWPAKSISSGRVGNLTSLECFNNILTSLDVSGLTALTSLICANNSLASLDVSGLTALERLYCYNNILTSLDVSGLTALAFLRCYTNSLTSLVATGVELSTGRCNDNELSEAALIAFADSLAETTAGTIFYGDNPGSTAFETWLITGDDKGYIWVNA